VNRVVSLVIGIVFLIIGILGLLLHPTGGNLFGFQVDLVHNLFHLITGILGIWAAFTGWYRRYNQVFGIIYLVLGILGLFHVFYFGGKLLGLMAVNGADNVLHLVVGIVATVAGFFVRDDITDIGTHRPHTGGDTVPRP
jgi:hypothetical protein